MSSRPLIFQSLLSFSHCLDNDSINSWKIKSDFFVEYPITLLLYFKMSRLIQCVTFFVIIYEIDLQFSTPFFVYLLVELAYTNTYISYL